MKNTCGFSSHIMATPRTGRGMGRPTKDAYGPIDVTSGALSARVAIAMRTLDPDQIESVGALIEDRNVRLAGIAALALGIGFGEKVKSNVYAMRVRLAAHELLARCCGDLQLGPAPLHLHASGKGESARVVFVNGDPLPTSAPAAPGRQLVLPDTDSKRVPREADPVCEVEPT